MHKVIVIMQYAIIGSHITMQCHIKMQLTIPKQFLARHNCTCSTWIAFCINPLSLHLMMQH